MRNIIERYGVVATMVFLATGFFCFHPFDANAVNLSMDAIPSLRLEQGWTSNATNTESDQVSSFYFRAVPGLALKFSTPDNVVFQLSSGYEKVWYYSSEAKSVDSNTFFFRLDSTGEVKITPNLSVIPTAYLVNTTTSDRRIQLLSSEDPAAPPSSNINYGNTKSESLGGGLAFKYQATPNLSIGLTGLYGEERFPNPVTGSGLTDSRTVGGGVSGNYMFNPRTSAGVSISGNHNTYDNNASSDIQTVELMFAHRVFTELDLEGGIGYSRVRQAAFAGEPELVSTAPAWRVKVTHISGTFSSIAFASAGFSGSSGFGVATRQWTAGLIFADEFTRNWNWNLSGTYQESKSVFDTNAVNLKDLYGVGAIHYMISRWASLDLTGHVNQQRSDGQFGNTLYTYAGVLGFTIGKPFNVF